MKKAPEALIFNAFGVFLCAAVLRLFGGDNRTRIRYPSLIPMAFMLSPETRRAKYSAPQHLNFFPRCHMRHLLSIVYLNNIIFFKKIKKNILTRNQKAIII